jgi:hypothetical protein
MTLRTSFRVASILIVTVLGLGLNPIHTAASHARIIRLSLVQGDVRILHDSKGDPLSSDKATWERAELNLPVRQHDVLATDNGRAEVEFENGAMAFINENSVLEFFDLSLDDGSLTTRLILRQGTGSFYVNPARDDYFSVTGGDFTAEAAGRANFRMDNFDDGSAVAVIKGQVSVVRKNDNKLLTKGQSLTMSADGATNISSAPQGDDFDRWVSGREDSVVTATNAARQYSSYSPYVSGFGDLYTYGGFYPIAGVGYGWQPYGVGLGWSPFDYGNWIYGAQFGWSFIGNQPWGWLPYHYGGWCFQPGIGWLWTPTGFRGGNVPVKFHPVTATFVRSGSTVAMVPTHPQDRGSKTPLNLAHAMPLNSAGNAQLAAGANWKVLKEKEVPAQTFVSHASPATAPARSARTLNSSGASGQPNGSTIAYDGKEHRFVNSNVSAVSAATTAAASTSAAHASSATTSSTMAARGASTSTPAARAITIERQVRTMPSASARVSAPPPAPRSSGSARGGFVEGGSSARGGSVTTSTRSTSTAMSGSRGSTMSGGRH